MLLRYIVSNFKSIGHPVEFSMFPTEKNVDERFLKKIQTKAGEWKVLHRGGFFGPNAAGKTSFIESIDFAADFIMEGQKSRKGTRINQFRGQFDDLNHKTIFQFTAFIYPHYRYQWQDTDCHRIKVCTERFKRTRIS